MDSVTPPPMKEDVLKAMTNLRTFGQIAEGQKLWFNAEGFASVGSASSIFRTGAMLAQSLSGKAPSSADSSGQTRTATVLAPTAMDASASAPPPTAEVAESSSSSPAAIKAPASAPLPTDAAPTMLHLGLFSIDLSIIKIFGVRAFAALAQRLVGNYDTDTQKHIPQIQDQIVQLFAQWEHLDVPHQILFRSQLQPAIEGLTRLTKSCYGDGVHAPQWAILQELILTLQRIQTKIADPAPK